MSQNNSVGWCQNYLDNRQQYIEYNNEKSSNLDIISGISQG